MAKRGPRGPAASHYDRATSAYKELSGAFSTHSSSTLVPGATVPVAGIQPGVKKSAGGLTVEAMRMGNFVDDPRLKKASTGHTDIIIKNGDDQDLSFMVGKFAQTKENLQNRGDTGFEFYLEVIVGLSALKRNRVVRVVLNSPEVGLPDLGATMRSDHLEAMKQRKQQNESKQVDSWNYFFAERPDRFNDKDIPRADLDKLIQVDGLVRLLRDISTRSGKGYTVVGDPVIRVSLESAAGIVLRWSHLQQPFFASVLYAWLHDMIAFTSGAGRDRLWSPQRQRFETISREQARRARLEAVSQVSMEDILR